MKMSKKAINFLQNLTLLLLLASALFLITRLPIAQNIWKDRSKGLLDTTVTQTNVQQSADFTGSFGSIHLISTDDKEYGRFAQLYMDPETPAFSEIIPLFREAIGSAVSVGPASDQILQTALDYPGFFLDMTSCFPIQAIAAWLGEETTLDLEIRALALTTETDDTASLYLYGSDRTILQYNTALPSSAIFSAVQTFSPNGGSFAFETAYSGLAPYTILVSETPSFPNVYAALPDGYSAYNLLTALDFNAHTNSRYVERDGTEVVEASPRTLRIGPDGTVSYTGDTEVSSSLYLVSHSGETSSASEALLAGIELANVLTSGTDAGPLSLYAQTQEETGWRIDFCYKINGIPVLLSNGRSALSITVRNNVITDFTYCCRSFTPSAESSTLLPPAMAAAIAAKGKETGLSIGYIDSAPDLLCANWLDG